MWRRLLSHFSFSSIRRFTALALATIMLLVSLRPTLAEQVNREAGAKSGQVANDVRSWVSTWSPQLFRSSLSFINAVVGAPMALASFASLGNSQSGNSDRGMPATPERSPGETPRRPHTRQEREARVSRLEMNTRGDTELQVGQRMLLSAVPLDQDGNAIHGLRAEWESTNSQVVFVTQEGEVTAVAQGRAQITASAGSKQVRLRITVIEATNNAVKGPGQPDVFDQPCKQDSKQSASKSFGERRKRARVDSELAHRRRFTGLAPQGGGRDPDYLFTPNNLVGTPPGKTTPGAKMPAVATGGTEMPGSANFQFSLPLVNLPGRGLDVDVTASYNSRIWNKAQYLHTTMSYDVDQGWPAPGFTLSYGHLQWKGSVTRCFELVDSNGTRHQLLDPAATGTPTYTYDSADGTFIHLVANAGSPPTPTKATYTDGTQVEFGAQNSQTLRYYPTKVTDRNGNYILISYVSGSEPRIYSIQDTLGRYIYFKYVGNDLIAITAPGLTGQADRPVVRFYYQDISNLNQVGLFQSGITVNAPLNGTAHVIKYIYMANSVETYDAHTGYRYDYCAYGMIYQIAKFQGMTISTAANDYTQAGQISSEGTQAALSTYNYPTTPGNLSDAPTYTTRTDDWAGRLSAQPIYTFSAPPGTGVSTVTSPDGMVSDTHALVDPGQPDDGLITDSIIKQGTTELSHTVISWQFGPSGAARPMKIQTTNEAIQTKAVVSITHRVWCRMLTMREASTHISYMMD